MALTVFTKRRGEKNPGEGYTVPLAEINRAVARAARLLGPGARGTDEECERILKAAAAILDVLLPPLESVHRLLDPASPPEVFERGKTAIRVRRKIHDALAALAEARHACREMNGREGTEPSGRPRAAAAPLPASRGDRRVPCRPRDPAAEERHGDRAAQVRRTMEEVAFHTNLLQLNARAVEGGGVPGKASR